MRRKKTVIIGLISGVLCASCVFLYLQEVDGRAEAARAEALARYGGEQLEVCVATRNIAAGEVIEPRALETKLWLADLLPEHAVRAADDVIGKQASSSIIKGEVISMQRFEERSGSFEVPDGFAAVSVPAHDVQAVGGVLEPGMSVDVYASGVTSTSLIAHNVQVLATSASLGAAQEGVFNRSVPVSWIILAVEPLNVQELIAAAQTSELSFVLPGSSPSLKEEDLGREVLSDSGEQNGNSAKKEASLVAGYKGERGAFSSQLSKGGE